MKFCQEQNVGIFRGFSIEEHTLAAGEEKIEMAFYLDAVFAMTMPSILDNQF